MSSARRKWVCPRGVRPLGAIFTCVMGPLIVCAGCYRHAEVDPSRLVPDPGKRSPIESRRLDEATASKLVRILEQRKAGGPGAVTGKRVGDALERLQDWKIGRPEAGEGKCFPQIEAVAALFADPSEDVRYHAIETAGKIGCPDVGADLERVKRSDKSPVVREAAARALLVLGLSEEAWGE